MVLQPYGCTVTETGNPKKVVIDPDSIYLQKADMGVRMVGEEKAVTPGESQLRIVDLDNLSEPVDITVNKDGSFTVELVGELEHVYRLRATYDDSRSKPVNVSGGEIDIADCIEVEPSTLLEMPQAEPGESTESKIVLTNACDQSVTLIESAFRLRTAAIQMEEQSTSIEIEPGERIDIDVTFSPTASGAFEAIAVFRFLSVGRVIIDITSDPIFLDWYFGDTSVTKSVVVIGKLSQLKE